MIVDWICLGDSVYPLHIDHITWEYFGTASPVYTLQTILFPPNPH